jgi:hypothetical protein
MTEPTQPTRERVTVKLRDAQKNPDPKPEKKPKENPNA